MSELKIRLHSESAQIDICFPLPFGALLTFGKSPEADFLLETLETSGPKKILFEIGRTPNGQIYICDIDESTPHFLQLPTEILIRDHKFTISELASHSFKKSSILKAVDGAAIYFVAASMIQKAISITIFIAIFIILLILTEPAWEECKEFTKITTTNYIEKAAPAPSRPYSKMLDWPNPDPQDLRRKATLTASIVSGFFLALVISFRIWIIYKLAKLSSMLFLKRAKSNRLNC